LVVCGEERGGLVERCCREVRWSRRYRMQEVGYASVGPGSESGLSGESRLGELSGDVVDAHCSCVM
jgi:hypothetical protein